MNGVVDDVRRGVMTQATKDKDEALKKVVENTRYLLLSDPQKLDAPREAKTRSTLRNQPQA